MAITNINDPSVQYLVYMVEKGMWDRYGADINELHGDMVYDYMHGEVMPRLKEEIRVITKSGFVDYFLIVADFMQWCRDNGIPVGPARGSAGGSAVSYCLYITDVNPLQFDLIFERFLNDERVAMPDIDLDICWHRRQDAIEYLVGKYGVDRVAQIVTFGTLSAKALLDDLGRVLRVPKKDVEELKGLIPEVEHVKLMDLVDEDGGAPDFVKKLHEVGEKEPRLIPAMYKLEGLHRHASMHAGGVVISAVPMTDLAPVFLPPKKKRQIVQYEMFDAESVGLLKIDILGLRTVTLVDWAEKDVRKHIDPEFHTRQYRLDDQMAFDLINRGDCYGIFQLDGTGITRFAQQLKIDSFNDIVALLALYRPGPLDSGMAQKYIDRKNGNEEVSYPHADLEPILRDTYGVITYQEQVMFIAQKMAGFTLGQADVLRSAMGKKDKVKMAKELDKFAVGAHAKGYDPHLIETMVDQIRTFARYGFNKSHAVAYGFLTYWTAVLKARYPAAFFSAWLNVTSDGPKQGWIIDQAARKNINILPPDVNESDEMFTMSSSDTIRFGLSAVKGMGASFVKKTVASREKVGKFQSYLNYCHRLSSIPVDKKEALVGSGAFDFDPHTTRAYLFKYCRQLNDQVKKGGDDPALYEMFPPELEYKPLEKADLEKEYVNFYISADPIKNIQEELRMMGGTVGIPVNDLRGEPVVGGRITNVHTLQTKKNDIMAFIDIDDGIVSHSVTLFPNVWKRVAAHMVKDGYTAMRCEIGRYRGQPTLQAIAVFPIDIKDREFDLTIDLGRPSSLILAQVKMILDSAGAGGSQVRIWVNDGIYKFLLKSDLYSIKVTDDIINNLKSVIGDAVSLQSK